MSCKDCFNGCSETTSDNCVKYTGPTVEALGITTGDSLSLVEAAIILNLTGALDGSKIYIDTVEVCELISEQLSSKASNNLSTIINALLTAVCTNDNLIGNLSQGISEINSEFTTGCITEEEITDAHTMIQLLIDFVCTLSTLVSELALDLENNYIKESDIDQYIADYLSSSGTTTAMSSKMVPNTVVEYYGSLSFFDATGAGTGDWENIYLCNGQNNTPDKRGRVAIGTTDMPGGSAMNAAVDPAITGNPSYSLLAAGGANTVTLTTNTMPDHTHGTVVKVTDPGHSHDVGPVDGGDDSGTTTFDGSNNGTVFKESETSTTNVSVSVTNGNTGGGQAHSNIQPVLACNYIMYIP